MPGFEEFIDQFSYNPETFNADEFKAAARAAFGEDTEHHTSELTSRDEKITELDGKNKSMGQALWDLQMKQGPKVTPPDPNTPPNPSGGDGDNKPKDVQSFFKKVER